MITGRRAFRKILLLTLTLLLVSGNLQAEEGKSGLAPSRVNLPAGPGSLEGIGENAEPNLSMGLVTYGVPLSVPSGYQGFSPQLSLSYSSAGGASVVGMGWALGAASSIERMTSRGLPDYDGDDLITAGGGELVRISDGTVFRSRDEGSYVRYHWLDAPEGRAGYFKAEYPDGSVGYFGADAEGTFVESARVETDGGTFQYQLVEQIDRFGHRIRYFYDKPEEDGRPYLSSIEWGYASGSARYSVDFEYEERQDVLSDAKSGTEVRLGQRLRNVWVRVRGALLRRYRLLYEPYSTTGGLTRLAGVRTFGTDDDVAHPIEFSFSYTGSFDPGCDETEDCSLPYVVEVGSVGVDFKTGDADLIDLNRDHLPDVVDTREGNHRFFLQTVDESGQSFAEVEQSGVAGSGAMALSSPSVHLMDLDGNGGADLIDGLNGRILFNDGQDDWGSESTSDLQLPDFATDPNLRFLDVDHDRYIDCIHIDPSGSWFYRNERNQSFSTEATLLDLEGLGFVEDALQLADVNGDGMLDLVQPIAGGWVHRLNLGHGRFALPIEMLGLPASFLPQETEFVDLDGDSLVDAVSVLGSEVRYALNRNGREFSDVVSLTEAEGGLVEAAPEVSIRFADMNGSGSTDVVWITPSGRVSYLELFPRRPHLLSRIENGIGKVTELTYGTSAEHMARDGGPSAWEHHLPHVMVTLDRLETYEILSGVVQTQTFHYTDGYFDGTEHQFNGFARVEVRSEGDETTETGLSVHRFDVGAEDRYRKGLPLHEETFSGARSLKVVEREYDDCPVAEVPEGTTPAVRHLCPVATTEEIREGSLPEEWVRIRAEFEYDGYGNVLSSRALGVVSRGGDGCGACADDAQGLLGAPCGATCAGDEVFTEKLYIEPGAATSGRWLLGLPYRQYTFTTEGAREADGGVYSEERIFYDGTPFEGLAAGNATLGSVSRSVRRVDDSRLITVARHRYDEHGNVVESLDANGHGVEFFYDEEGLLLISEERIFDDPGHDPYRLRQSLEYDPLLEQPIGSTDWTKIDGASVQSSPRVTLYAYDQFARLTRIARPGDALDAPTSEFIYELGAPVSRIIQRTRSEAGGSYDLESVQCFDGMGRKLQTRQRIASGLYQISGFSEFNSQGGEFRTLQPHQSPTGQCATRASESVLSVERTFDAVGRVIEQTRPDGALYDGTPTVLRTEYRPLRTTSFDGEDSASGSNHADTPTTSFVDGQGRTTRIERLLQDGSDPVVSRFAYDALGNLALVVDDAGNEKKQEYDRLGRVIRVEDPDAGVIEHEYDDVGNLVRSTDARGVTVATEYDEADRPVREYELGSVEETLIERFYDSFEGCSEQDCPVKAGQLVAVRYPVLDGTFAEDHFGFDARGRQSFFSREIGGYEFRFETEFDNADRPVGTTYPTGERIETVLDGLNRPVSVPGFVEEIEYEDRGLPAHVTLASGVETEYGYDPALRLASLQTHLSGSLLQDYSYERDRADNIIAVIDGRDDERAATANALYTYDSFYRLIQADIEPDHPERAETVFVAYDRIDNIEAKHSSLEEASAAHVGDYVYGRHGAGPHAVSSAGHRTYRYDDSGNQVLRHQHGLGWNHLQQLAEVHHQTRRLGRFAYAADGERVAKRQGPSTTLYVTSDFEVRDGVSTIYVSGPSGTVAKIEDASLADEILGDTEADDSDSGEPRITAADAYLMFHGRDASTDGDPDLADQMLASSARQTLLDEGRRVTFLHRDHLGTAAVTTDEEGRVVQRTEHYPYGTVRAAQSYLEDYSFTGQERDAFTELSYHSARYLDPHLGRWTAADPLFVGASASCLASPGECNGYGYALGNPIALADPSGTETMGEFLDRRAMSAAGRGSHAATYGWAFAATAWNYLGAEAVSKVADGVISGRTDVSTMDYVMAGVESNTFTKGAKWIGAAGSGIWKGGKGLLSKFKRINTGSGTHASGRPIDEVNCPFCTAGNASVPKMTSSEAARISGLPEGPLSGDNMIELFKRLGLGDGNVSNAYYSTKDLVSAMEATGGKSFAAFFTRKDGMGHVVNGRRTIFGTFFFDAQNKNLKRFLPRKTIPGQREGDPVGFIKLD